MPASAHCGWSTATAPALPAADWVHIEPVLSGICGSDLATLDGRSSRYFEDIVSFPFVPGHEVVGTLAEDAAGAEGGLLPAGGRVVLQPVLGCAARGIEPACPACQAGNVGNCGRVAFGHIRPGLQTGFCADTGGGWSSTGLVAHSSQLYAVPDTLTDEDAVTVEPVACAVHAVLGAPIAAGDVVAVIGAGTLGLLVTAALGHLSGQGRCATPSALLVGARYAHQQRLARELGATEALPSDQLGRAVRRHSRSLSYGGASGVTATLSGGADVVLDCVGSAESIAQSLAMVRPRGTVRADRHAGQGDRRPGPPLAPRGAPGGGLRLRDRTERRDGCDRSARPGVDVLLGLRRRRRAQDRAPGLGHVPFGPLRGCRGPCRRRRSPWRREDRIRRTERTDPMSRRPGFVLEVDKSTPPTLFWSGEGFGLETLPEGSRVVYAPEPMKAIEDPYRAIRHALLHPEGDRDPLPALLRPGMKLTICFDDVSLPLPPMEAPDIRQMVIETVLDMAAEAGVDDVELIAALALHRRMTEEELRHALGDRVYDAFAPHGLLTQHDAEDPDNLLFIGETDQGEEVEINKRAATSDLLVYVNINLVAMDGGHKSVATGLASYRSLRHHHNPQTMRHSKSFMDQPASELHSANWRMGRLIAESGVKIFQIETTLNNDTFPSNFGFLQKREWEWSLRDRASYAATSKALSMAPPRVARQIFHSIRSPHALTSVQAGEVEAVHAVTTANVWAQQGVDVEGQTDILTMGLPYICPYNVNSIMNPILVACLGLGYFFNMYRGKPLVREGGVVIMKHPTRPEFHPGHHPSYIDFYEQVLTQTVDPMQMHKEFEESFATDPWYVHLYRTGHAYHGVHPFYMWYWCAHALAHLGRVIVVGGDPKAVRRLGFSPASSLDDALEIASDVVGPSPTLTHMHNPPIFMSDVH